MVRQGNRWVSVPFVLGPIGTTKFFNKAFQDGLCTDVIIRAFGKEYKAHRAVLLSRSEYFENLFCKYPSGLAQQPGDTAQLEQKGTSSRKRSSKVAKNDTSKDAASAQSSAAAGAPGSSSSGSQNCVATFNLEFGDDITQMGFEFMLQALYFHPDLRLTADNTREVLVTAQFFQVKELEDYCVKSIIRNLNPDNLLEWYQWAKDSITPEPVQKGILEGCLNLLSMQLPGSFERWRPVLSQLDRGFVVEMLKSGSLAVESELERHELARKVAEAMDSAQAVVQGLGAGLGLRSMAVPSRTSARSAGRHRGVSQASRKEQAQAQAAGVGASSSSSSSSAPASLTSSSQQMLAACIDYSIIPERHLMRLLDEGVVDRALLLDATVQQRRLQYAVLQAPAPAKELPVGQACYQQFANKRFRFGWRLRVGDLPTLHHGILEGSPTYYAGSKWRLFIQRDGLSKPMYGVFLERLGMQDNTRVRVESVDVCDTRSALQLVYALTCYQLNPQPERKFQLGCLPSLVNTFVGDERDVTEECGTNWGRSDMVHADDIQHLQKEDTLFISCSLQLAFKVQDPSQAAAAARQQQQEVQPQAQQPPQAAPQQPAVLHIHQIALQP